MYTCVTFGGKAGGRAVKLLLVKRSTRSPTHPDMSGTVPESSIVLR